ncbi:MAG TPA: type II toxin-antitoxin system RelE/ParE family toxin [Acidobacteriota bacterium]
MILPVVTRLAAASDLDEAYRWYEERHPGLGDEFLDEVRVAFQSISEYPERYSVIHRQTRRALLHRFPYGIYYRVMQKQIVVVGCFHAKRDPRSWQSRG